LERDKGLKTMTETKISSTRQKLKSPRAAAIAGILFAVLYTTSLMLIRISVPTDPSGSTDWLETHYTLVSLGLNLVPFAGIAFLWFIGVIRDRLGEQEDRLFATVLLGSGLLFLAMTFTGAALAGGILNSYLIKASALIESGVYLFGREVVFQIINIYAIRMAGVFMISLGTIWLRTGLMHRGWAFVTYALALVLLLSTSFAPWVPLFFPGWVFAVSIYFLIQNYRHRGQETSNPM
jgi:hypothetical protein